MIHVVFGTKAQLIKIAPVLVELQNQKIDYHLIFTGQHQKTIANLQENFNIKRPDVILHTGKDITGIVQMFFWMLKILLKTIFQRKKIFPVNGGNDIVLVHGDTFSTVLGALMGYFAGKKVGHIESGLRSFNIFHPFPEEICRLITFRLSDIYYCPGGWAVDNLKKYKGEKINTEINTLYDCLQYAKKRINEVNVKIPSEKYGVVSLHRFENIFNKQRLGQLVGYLLDISKKYRLLFILHLPTKKQLVKFGLLGCLEQAENIELRPRYDYFQFIKLVIKSEFVITDGGSNQEESAYLGKPTLIFRKTTERQEGLGTNAVISNYDKSLIDSFIENYSVYSKNGVEIKETPSSMIVNSLASFVK